MMYTPEELTEYVFQNGMEMQVFNAMVNNRRGYQFTPADGEIVKREDGYYFLWSISDGDGKHTMNKKMAELSNSDFEMAYKNPYMMCSSVRMYNGEGMIILAISENEKDREKKEQSLTFEDFFQCLGINTLGKLKKVISEGEEMVTSFMEASISRTPHGCVS